MPVSQHWEFFIGQFAGMNLMRGNNNIEIGNEGGPKDSETIHLGDPSRQKNTFIAGTSGVTVSNGVAVMINSKGQLGVTTSSASYKENVKPMEKASEAILSLQPITFRYKRELDSLGTPQFGLVAEEVAKVAPRAGRARRDRQALHRPL